jgi:acyl-CoA thioesterase-1
MFASRLNRRHCIAALAAAGFGGSLPGAAAAVPAQKILVVGDSLSAEYGLQRGTGWVALLEQRLARERIAASVVNASISGDTTAGGRARLATLLRQQPTHVVIELGGNDALRGLPLASTEANLAAMVRASKEAKARVLVLGMQVPPNYGASYARDFAALFERVAKTEGVALLPFMLKGVADDADPMKWFQEDRIHPRAEAHPRILDNVWSALKPLLKG